MFKILENLMELAECGMKYPHSSCIHPVNRRRDSGKCLFQPPRSNFGLHIANIPNKKVDTIYMQLGQTSNLSLFLSLSRKEWQFCRAMDRHSNKRGIWMASLEQFCSLGDLRNYSFWFIIFK